MKTKQTGNYVLLLFFFFSLCHGPSERADLSFSRICTNARTLLCSLYMLRRGLFAFAIVS